MFLPIITTISVIAAVTAFIFHVRFKKSMKQQVDLLETKFQEEANKRTNIETDFSSTISKEQDEIKVLLEEIKNLHAEKEEEMELRLEAQNQIDLALQKTENIQKRMEDWKTIQDAAVEDARKEISDLGEKLYERLAEEFERDLGKNEQLILNLQQNLSLIMNKFSLTPIAFNAENFSANFNLPPAPKKLPTPPLPPKRENSAPKPPTPKEARDVKELLSQGLKTLLENNSFLFEKDFFLNVNIMENKDGAKPLIIDSVLSEDEERASSFDFKLMKYIEEYRQTYSEDVLKQKLDKLLAYLENEKLIKAILNWIGAKTGNKMETLHFITPVLSSDDVKILEDIDYLEKFEDQDIEVLDISSAG